MGLVKCPECGGSVSSKVEMIPTDVVREKTGLCQGRLSYMRRLGLIPHPTRIPTPGRLGSTYAYPASIFTRIRVIEFLQGHGFTLTQIVQAARGTPFACEEGGPGDHR